MGTRMTFLFCAYFFIIILIHYYFTFCFRFCKSRSPNNKSQLILVLKKMRNVRCGNFTFRGIGVVISLQELAFFYARVHD